MVAGIMAQETAILILQESAADFRCGIRPPSLQDPFDILAVPSRARSIA